ncbi:MAG: hypothetical protein J5I90_18595 [Caldilineales bacterium]|nr:hypothetical protein [Caldilineales bacterium]
MTDLPADITFQIDFNVQTVAAAIGVPISDAAIAAVFGINEGDLSAYLAEVQKGVESVAVELLSDEELSTALRRWPTARGQKVMMVGDSITTYRRGYARLFEAMLALARPGDDIYVTNVAQSGFTSTHGLELTYTQLLAQKPDWVFIKYGGNDCKQFGGPDASTLVPIGYYEENLRRMVLAFRKHADASVILITPTPVVEDVVNTLPDFLPMHMTWDNRNLAAYAEVVRRLGRELDTPVADFYSLFGAKPSSAYFLEDGLHPNPKGHRLMVQRLVKSIAQ